MYTTVRKYEGVTNPQEASRKVQEGFVPMISAMPGFVEYQWVDLGHGAMLSISVFDVLGHAIESNQAASSWVAKNLPSVLAQPSRIENGRVVARKSASNTKA
jgi:hypothetical protein